MSKFARRMRAWRLEGASQPVLERPHPARWTHVLGFDSAGRSVGQPDDTLFAAVRAGDDRDQNPPERIRRRNASPGGSMRA